MMFQKQPITDQDDSMMSVVSYSQHWTEALPLNRLNVSLPLGRVVHSGFIVTGRDRGFDD